MNLGLDGRIALVLGSSSGLGFAAAMQLAREGAIVAINGRDVTRLEEAHRRILADDQVVDGKSVLACPGDVSTVEGCASVVDLVAEHFGGLDILLTNAGGPPTGRFEDMAEADWSRATDLTLMSAVRVIRSALPHLEASDAASVLTITSISLKQPIEGLLLSNVMRPAIAGMTKTLSQELAPDGIRVNSILPGWTATERVRHIFEDRAQVKGTTPEEEMRAVTDAIPMKRMAEPEEFGRVAAFLCSPAASYITGAMIQVDGGSYTGLL